MRTAIAAVTAVLFIIGAGAAEAADPRHPDWPCQQIEVPTLSLAAFWAGPPVDDVGDAWRNDQAVSDLVLKIAARRTPLADAEKAAADFVAGAPDEKTKKAKLLMAGVFATLNGERGQVVAGIKRFATRQIELRAKISKELTSMRADQGSASGPDNPETDKLGEQIAWDTRVFDERRHTITYVCEVPGVIEQRLGGIARAVQGKLDQGGN
ncbi:MAG: hypothetical protein ACTHLO_14185 [Pseudolabrys sp.]